jgi:hypothetical protein
MPTDSSSIAHAVAASVLCSNSMLSAYAGTFATPADTIEENSKFQGMLLYHPW